MECEGTELILNSKGKSKVFMQFLRKNFREGIILQK